MRTTKSTAMAVTLIIFSILISFVILWYYYIRKYKDVIKLPGPSALHMIRNMFDNRKSAQEVFRILINLNTEYGPVVKLWLNPFKPLLVVTDLKYVEYFLTSNVHLDKSDFYKFLEAYIGTGLASSGGDIWKRQRKQLSPAFHNKIIEGYVKIFGKYWKKLIEQLKKEVSKESVDVFPLLNDCTLRIICETFLDREEPTISDNYMEARTAFYSLIIERILSVVKQHNFLYKFTKSYKIERECVKIMKRLSGNIISNYKSERGDCVNSSIDSKQHLMEVLLEDKNLNDDEIQNQVDTIIIAGHDTSASTLSFGLFEMAKHLDLQTKVLEETNSILGEDKDAEITFHDLQQLKYLDCVIKEVLRLYAPVPLFDRKTREDVTIDGVNIPRGTDVSICAYNIHRSENNFSNPEKFDPERFMPERVDSIHPFSFIPFSYGPRSCIGKHFAMLEMKSALAKIIRNFELHPTEPEHRLELSTEFVLKSDTGMRIKLKLR